MKKITFLLVGLCLLTGSNLFAQTQLAGAKKSLVVNGLFVPSTIEEKEPMPYPGIREADVVWSKTIWRIIDLRERINFPFYYPTEIMDARKSFVQAVIEAAQEGKITLYEDEDFTEVFKPENVKDRFDAADRTERRQRMDGTEETVTIRGDINWAEVQEILVKEIWYFDRHYSKMDVRIIGVCPTRVYNKELRTNDDDNDDDEFAEKLKQQLFWVYYPDTRKILANTPCYLGNNEMAQISFDDLFIKRRFSSYIVAESDNQNNRRLDSYSRNDFEKMLKAEEIKMKILNFEDDLWEY